MKNEASSSNGREDSVVVDCGRRRSSCGYCKSSGRTSISHGLWAHSITVNDYQDLLDRGWRRSGCFLYKPEMERTCCPSYTIRLKASDFVPSKDQLRVYRRMNRWVSIQVARPLLDKKKYAILSNVSSLQDVESSKSCAPESVMELQHNDIELEDTNVVPMDDEEMVQIQSESSDDELEPETSDLAPAAIDNGDLSNVLVGLRGSRLRYKELRRAFGPTEMNYLETQLRSYQRVVGVELSERMVYSLG